MAALTAAESMRTEKYIMGAAGFKRENVIEKGKVRKTTLKLELEG